MQALGICLLLPFIADKASAKGQKESEAFGLTPYDVTPRAPVRADSSYACVPPPQRDALGDIYQGYTLGYYDRFPQVYRSFLTTPAFDTMKDGIGNGSFVCVNHYVTSGNVTLGAFTCPLSRDESADFHMCCGEPYAEFCCLETHARWREHMLGAVTFAIIFATIVAIGTLCYLILGRNGPSQKKELP